MFCKKCGSQLVDDARFCANCGSQVDSAPYVAPTTQPIQPRTPNPMFSKFVTAITTFVKNPVAAVGDAAKSKTHEWSLFAAIVVTIYALTAGVLAEQSYGDFLSSFATALITASAGFFGVAAGLWLFASQIFKKEVSIISMFNMVGVAVLPLVAICVPNMIFGLIDGGLVWAIEAAAMVISVILLYEGTKACAEFEKPVFLGFCIVVVAVIVAVWLISLLCGEIFVSSPADAYADIVDDFVDMFDY